MRKINNNEWDDEWWGTWIVMSEMMNDEKYE